MGTSSADGDHDMTPRKMGCSPEHVGIPMWHLHNKARSPPSRGLLVHQRFESFPHLCPETFPQKGLLVTGCFGGDAYKSLECLPVRILVH